MSGTADVPRDLSSLVVPRRGSLQATDDLFEPYRLGDGDGVAVIPVMAFLRDLQACGRSANTLRSYGLDLLRWFRFLWAVEIGWDRATAVEARDFCCWIQAADKPTGPHWRHRGGDRPQSSSPTPESPRVPGAPNRVTGKPVPGVKYAPSTTAHCETVLRSFYDFHLEVGSGPMVNPFPLTRARRGARANAHHNPMDAFTPERGGRFRPKVGERVPRQILTRSSTNCSPSWDHTGTGHWYWSRSGYRLAPGRRNCWVPPTPTPTRASS